MTTDNETDELENTWTCHACGGPVPDDEGECPSCGFDRAELDPDDPYSGEDAGFQFR